MSAFHLRAAQPTDAGAVGAILSGFIDETSWMPRIHSRAEDISFAGMMIERGWVTVATQDGRVVGFSAFNAPDLQSLYVGSDARGKGCGKVLLDAIKSQADAVQLWTFQANHAAQRFYLREGFAETARTEGVDNDEGLPDIKYVWVRGA